MRGKRPAWYGGKRKDPETVMPASSAQSHPLTPEEESIDDPDDVADELDDMLPADLWF